MTEKEDEQNCHFHVWFSQFLKKASGTYKVDLAIELLKDVVSKLVHSSALFFCSGCSYTLCTGGNSEPAPSLLTCTCRKDYCTS